MLLLRSSLGANCNRTLARAEVRRGFAITGVSAPRRIVAALRTRGRALLATAGDTSAEDGPAVSVVDEIARWFRPGSEAARAIRGADCERGDPEDLRAFRCSVLPSAPGAADVDQPFDGRGQRDATDPHVELGAAVRAPAHHRHVRRRGVRDLERAPTSAGGGSRLSAAPASHRRSTLRRHHTLDPFRPRGDGSASAGPASDSGGLAPPGGRCRDVLVSRRRGRGVQEDQRIPPALSRSGRRPGPRAARGKPPREASSSAILRRGTGMCPVSVRRTLHVSTCVAATPRRLARTEAGASSFGRPTRRHLHALMHNVTPAGEEALAVEATFARADARTRAERLRRLPLASRPAVLGERANAQYRYGARGCCCRHRGRRR